MLLLNFVFTVTQVPQGNKGWVPGISGPQRATSLCSDLREVPIKASLDSQASSWRKVKGTSDVHRAGLDTGLVTQRCSRGHTGLAAALSRAAAPDNKLSRKWTCPLMPRDSPESGHRHREAPGLQSMLGLVTLTPDHNTNQLWGQAS